MMMSPVFRPRQRKDKHKILEKIHFDFYRYIICLAILAFTLLPLFLSWGALELEGFANTNYDAEPKYGTDITCFFTTRDDRTTRDDMCAKILKNQLHRNVVYYGIRIDCILSSPLILISFWLFFQESFGKYVLYAAHFCAWTKFISITAVLTCVLIDEPSFMRETFEKSQFGSYESKLLYSFTMVSLSAFFDICLVIALVIVNYLPDTPVSKYRVGPPQPAEYMSVLANVKQVVAKSRNASRVSVVEAFPIGDLISKETFAGKSNPV
ncbi:uncharacterized protein CELE_C10A4.2 [Caenorhabditis elegans]|uniref:Transmembrane protein n=1 Tax=Caenorhabditis elegans TaxID=6239 RepID=Q17892_CAEEL|nr:Transmembrane protein [Caenorhabditis elegans]CCD62394.2 Transmembrane protein [Caenorhabditis elegans]|eukprot:NP_509253.2 Uncharacterized protein CELE_C10A4.2 [Caenorhabditis elegans]